jgi:inhibitor of cysteine peptidase
MGNGRSLANRHDGRLLAAAVLAAVTLAASPGATSSLRIECHMTQDNVYLLSAADDGKTVELRAGASLSIRLPENPSTGYRWDIDIDPAHVEVEQRRFVQLSNQVGGGGETCWVLRTKAPGVTSLKLKLWRPWEDERAAIQRVEVTLRITP